MSTDRLADDVRSSRAAQRAERLGRLRATALSTVIENPTPRGLPADEPAIIAGGLSCQDESVADMALPLAELPAAEPLPPRRRAAEAIVAAPLAAIGSAESKTKDVEAKGFAAQGFAAKGVEAKGVEASSALAPHPFASQLAPMAPIPSRAAEEVAKTALWSDPAPAATHAEPASSAPAAAPSPFAATTSQQPPLAQPSSQTFRLDAAEGLSPRPPFAMPAFSLAKNDAASLPKNDAAQQPEKAEPSAYAVGELYRQLRQNVLGQLTVGQGAIVWICPTGSEPLSDHLVELASALAEGCDGEILLVDANFQSASLTRRFNLGEKSGLADVLAKKLAAHAAGHETAVARVRVLPKGGDAVGRAARRANEEEWKSLLAGLKERYRYVLIDAPGVEEPHCLPLAKAADATFVAIALDHTPRETVQEALEHLHLHKARVAGCVITDAPA